MIRLHAPPPEHLQPLILRRLARDVALAVRTPGAVIPCGEWPYWTSSTRLDDGRVLVVVTETLRDGGVRVVATHTTEETP